MALACAALLFGLTGRAQAGGPMKGDGGTLEIVLGVTAAALYFGPTTSYVLAVSRDEPAGRGGVVAGALIGTIGLGSTLLLGLRRDWRDVGGHPWFHVAGGLSSQLVAFAYPAWADRTLPPRTLYGFSWLLGAPFYTTAFALTETLRGEWMSRGASGSVLAVGGLQALGAGLWLALDSSRSSLERGLLIGAAAWGGALIALGSASLFGRRRSANTRASLHLAPSMSLGSSRALGMVVAGDF